MSGAIGDYSIGDAGIGASGDALAVAVLSIPAGGGGGIGDYGIGDIGIGGSTFAGPVLFIGGPSIKIRPVLGFVTI